MNVNYELATDSILGFDSVKIIPSMGLEQVKQSHSIEIGMMWGIEYNAKERRQKMRYVWTGAHYTVYGNSNVSCYTESNNNNKRGTHTYTHTHK